MLTNAWQASLTGAKNLREGKEVGRIGFYAPAIVIKGNMIDSITGIGFLFPNGQRMNLETAVGYPRTMRNTGIQPVTRP